MTLGQNSYPGRSISESKNDNDEIESKRAEESSQSKVSNGELDSPSELELGPAGEYIIRRNKPETFLNNDDLEKVTESDIYVQKRLFSFIHSRKVPYIPHYDDERKTLSLYNTNIFSSIFFLWVTPLLMKGYKRTIQPNDLFKMRPTLSVETMYCRFQRYFSGYVAKGRANYKKQHPEASEQEVKDHSKLPRFCLVRTLFFTFKWYYISACMCAVLANCASGFNPMITKRLIDFVEKKAVDHGLRVNKGIGYAIGASLIVLLNGILISHMFVLAQIVGVEVKSVLTKAILDKVLKASNYTRHKFSIGKVTSIVTTDMSRIEFAILFQPILAGFPATLTICIVLLVINIGPISMSGIGLFFVMFFLSIFSFKYIIDLRLSANKFTDDRVTTMREILSNAKMVKLYAWEDAYENNIKLIRSKEVSKVRKLQIARNFLLATTIALPNIASLITFLALYKVNGGGRTPGNIFSSLSLFQVMSIQMFYLPTSIGTTIDMVIGLKRIEEILGSSEEKNSVIHDVTPSVDLSENVAIKMTDASFEWEDYEKIDIALDKATKGIADVSTKPFNNANESVASDRTSFKGFHNLTFDILKGEFIVVTGPIGTGKTSLLNAISGFMSKTSGHIEVGGRLLSCGYPWIQNATVRDNIIFGSPYERGKYHKIIQACSLDSDLNALPAGDMTEIGERGVNLSGGQKARINLARCVYKDEDIYLFDDVLSAVDARVGKHIMDECFLSLIGDKTRILATHQLALIEKASRLIVLGNDGSFAIGTFRELKKSNAQLKKLLQFTSNDSDKDCDFGDESDIDQIQDLNEDLELRGKCSEGLDEHGNIKKTTECESRVEINYEGLEKQVSQKSIENKDRDRLITTKEERAFNSIKLGVYSEYLRVASGKWRSVVTPLYLVTIMGSTFCQLFTSVWLAYWTEDKFKGRSTSFYMGLYSFFVFGEYMFMNVQFTLLCFMGLTASKYLNLKAVRGILHTPLSFMDSTPLGRILNRFTKDTDNLDNELIGNVRLMMFQVGNVVGVIIMCIVYLPWFAIAVPFLLFMFVMIADYYQSSSREVKRLEAVQRSFVYNNINEILSGLDTIRAYRSQERFLAKSDFLINKMNEAGYVIPILQGWVAVSLDLLVVIFTLIITLLCVTRQFKISPSATGVLLTYILQLPDVLYAVLEAATQTENGMNSAERLVTYALGLPSESDYKKPGMKPPESWPERGEITFENVFFVYRPNSSPVLKNFNLNIESGEKIGICGRTGAGKSTIMSALFRINELMSGSICIDDVNIANLGLFELRSKLAIIPQDPVLFRGSIRKNLDPFGEKTDNDLWKSLIRSGAIGIDDLSEIEAQRPDDSGSHAKMHKFHLDQRVEEEGENFSLGEKQLLALTRALVRSSRILILDEATSSVDYETDDMIQSRITEAFTDCTILCIAHRLNTILNYDRILVLEQGKVVEFDTPSILFQKQDGVFRSMCERANIKKTDFKSIP